MHAGPRDRARQRDERGSRRVDGAGLAKPARPEACDQREVSERLGVRHERRRVVEAALERERRLERRLGRTARERVQERRLLAGHEPVGHRRDANDAVEAPLARARRSPSRRRTLAARSRRSRRRPRGRRARSRASTAPSSTRCGLCRSSALSFPLAGSPSAAFTTTIGRPPAPRRRELRRRREAGAAAAAQPAPSTGAIRSSRRRAAPKRRRWRRARRPDAREPEPRPASRDALTRAPVLPVTSAETMPRTASSRVDASARVSRRRSPAASATSAATACLEADHATRRRRPSSRARTRRRSRSARRRPPSGCPAGRCAARRAAALQLQVETNGHLTARRRVPSRSADGDRKVSAGGGVVTAATGTAACASSDDGVPARAPTLPGGPARYQPRSASGTTTAAAAGEPRVSPPGPRRPARRRRARRRRRSRSREPRASRSVRRCPSRTSGRARPATSVREPVEGAPERRPDPRAQQARHDEREQEVEGDRAEPEPDRAGTARRTGRRRPEPDRREAVRDRRHDVQGDEDDREQRQVAMQVADRESRPAARRSAERSDAEQDRGRQEQQGDDAAARVSGTRGPSRCLPRRRHAASAVRGQPPTYRTSRRGPTSRAGAVGAPASRARRRPRTIAAVLATFASTHEAAATLTVRQGVSAGRPVRGSSR